MPEPVFLVTAVLAFLIGALLARRAWNTSRLVATLRGIRPAAVADLQDGLRLAAGTARVAAPIPSAFHRTPCAYYAYRVENRVVGEPRPRRLAVGKDWADLAIEDPTGRAAIEHRPALILSPHERRTHLGRLERIPPQHADFFDAAGIDPKHLPRFNDLTVIEYTLEDGDPVHVLGTVRNGPDGKVFYRAGRSPLAVSQSADAGLAPGYRNEVFLFGVAATLVAAFGLLFLGLAFA